MGYFGPYFMILVQPTSKVVFNALKSVTTFDLISYDHQSPYVTCGLLTYYQIKYFVIANPPHFHKPSPRYEDKIHCQILSHAKHCLFSLVFVFQIRFGTDRTEQGI